MAKYKLTETGVLNKELMCFIPNDDANYDWIAYKEWLSVGNVPDPEFTEQELLDKGFEQLRMDRDRLLYKTDFLVLPDVFSRYNEQEQIDIITYRKALREVPKNTTDPTKVVWPNKPQVIIKAGI